MNDKTKLKVLIIDDELHIRTMLKLAMTSSVTEVVGLAKNGNEGVKLFKELNPDIVLLDINMPYKTGLEVLEEIKQIEKNAFVVMLTSVADKETVLKALELGADTYILKDTPLEEIKKLIVEAWKSCKDKL